jgi:hypothetical protein
MSKSYSNYKTVGMAKGSNTSFYKDRRRKDRTKNKQIIRNMMANYNAEDFDEVYESFKQAKKDSWSEPTDGSKRLTAEDDLENYDNIYTYNGKIKK